jgi:hypothetical protein
MKEFEIFQSKNRKVFCQACNDVNKSRRGSVVLNDVVKKFKNYLILHMIAQRAIEIIRYSLEGMQEEFFIDFKNFIFVIGN